MGNMQRPYNSMKYGISCIAATFAELLECISYLMEITSQALQPSYTHMDVFTGSAWVTISLTSCLKL